MSIKSGMPNILFSSCLQSFQASGSFLKSQLFVSGGQSIELQLQHQSFQWIFRIDWFNLLAVPGTLKSLLQHHSSKASILQRSAFFMVQLSHPYKTIGKTRALSRWTFVNKVMSLLFNALSRLLIVFSSKEQGLLILWAAVTICSDFGAPKNKVYHCFHWFPVYLPWSDGTRCHDLGFLNVEF